MKEIKTLRKIVSMYFLRKALIMNIYENYTKKKKLVVILLYKTISVTL